MGKVNFSQLLVNPENQAEGHLNWLTSTNGYYYTAFVNEYNKLTYNELTYIEALAISDVEEYYNNKSKDYHLEEYKTTYSNFHKVIHYFFKLGIITKGKVTVSIYQVDDHFNVTIVYATRNKFGADIGSPNTFKPKPMKLTLAKQEDDKSKRRYKMRKSIKKKRRRHNSNEFNKVYTSDSNKNERVRRRYKDR